MLQRCQLHDPSKVRVSTAILDHPKQDDGFYTACGITEGLHLEGTQVWVT